MWAELATRQPDVGEPHPTSSLKDLRQRFAAIAEVDEQDVMSARPATHCLRTSI